VLIQLRWVLRNYCCRHTRCLAVATRAIVPLLGLDWPLTKSMLRRDLRRGQGQGRIGMPLGAAAHKPQMALGTLDEIEDHG
jgi:hypothetical protein